MQKKHLTEETTVSFYLTHGYDPYQVLLHRVRMDLGAMALKEYFAFPKVPALLEPHNQIVSCHMQDTCWGVLPLWREAVGIFYRPSRLGMQIFCWTLAFHSLFISVFVNTVSVSSLLNTFHLYKYIQFFISFRIFGLLPRYFLSYSQRFGRCVLRPSLDVSFRTREPRGTSNLTLYLTRGGRLSKFFHHNWVQVLSYCKYSTLKHVKHLKNDTKHMKRPKNVLVETLWT